MIAIKDLKELYDRNKGISAKSLIEIAEVFSSLPKSKTVHVGDIKMKNTLCPAYSNGNCVSPHTQNTICDYNTCKLFDNR